jgi:hypothetical protein
MDNSAFADDSQRFDQRRAIIGDVLENMIGDDQIVALRLQAGVGHVHEIFPAIIGGVEFGEPCRVDALIGSKLQGAPLRKQGKDGFVDLANNPVPLYRVAF